MTANTTASVRAFADRRWLCLISAMVICVCAGFGYAWSVLQTPIIARFGWADSGPWPTPSRWCAPPWPPSSSAG